MYNKTDERFGSVNKSELIPCENGWTYETSVYQKTIVTEVSYTSLTKLLTFNNYITVGFSL